MSLTPDHQELDRSYRGYMTCRLLTSTQLPRLSSDSYLLELIKSGMEDKNLDVGELEYLGMSPRELIGKVLDIGIGGGRSLVQALENNIDMYGVEIGLLADWGSIHPGARTVQAEQIAKNHLRRVIQEHPDRVWQVDAAQHIPAADGEFNTVISCIALPSYARSSREVLTCILEMIRVSSRHVAFHTDYSEVPDISTLAIMGLGANKFAFPMAQFLKELGNFGVSLEWRSVIHPIQKDTQVISAHLDTTNKHQASLTEYATELYASYASQR